jgi:predicted phosphodiesterase
MKNYLILAAMLFFTINTQAQNDLKLRFNKKGKFKIVQFTDTHVELHRNKNLSVYKTIKTVLDIEKPDFVILTGDIVTEDNPEEAYRRFAEIFKEAKIPWAAIWGNHDSEHNASRERIARYVEKLPYCQNKDVENIAGVSNYILPVYGKKDKIEALLYCMDSGDYSTLKPLVDGYGWFELSQINWYLKRSKEYTRANHGKPIPALAFFHIPLPEYTDAWNNKDFPPVGVRNEDECSPDINTGMFAAMLQGGDVMGTFVGHDHINDYIGVYYNIALAYGRVTKIMKNPQEDPLAGGRVIVLKEGQREFDTWIRDMNGKKELFCNFPKSFQTSDKNE